MKKAAVLLLLAVMLLTACRAETPRTYGVFIGADFSDAALLRRASGCDLVVVDGQQLPADALPALHDGGAVVYSYLNIGALENFRPYYDTYAHLALAPYENWLEEFWADVADPDWQQFLIGRAAALAQDGIDGFFLDNCDVYAQFPREEIYRGLLTILTGIRALGLPVILNGGDLFVQKVLADEDDLPALFTGVNQEGVYTTYDFARGKSGAASAENLAHYIPYLHMLTERGIDVYLLEYTTDRRLIRRIAQACDEYGWQFYAAPSIELDK